MGHRRGSGTRIAAGDFRTGSELVPPGWGLATWQPDVMKIKDPVAVSIPPIGVHAAACCMRYWKRPPNAPGFRTARPDGCSRHASYNRTPATSPYPTRYREHFMRNGWRTPARAAGAFCPFLSPPTVAETVVLVYAWRPLSRGGWCTAGHAFGDREWV